MSELGTLQERWDIYYRQFRLHSCMHHECIWTDGMWYFPEPGRRADTLHMFAPSRWGPIKRVLAAQRDADASDYRYYDFYLPNGTMIEHMAWRYIGNGDPKKDWLQDYVAYDLNMVTVDMVVIDPNALSN